jgi:sulfopyruvate decarboxylase TPP-binding subunit
VLLMQSSGLGNCVNFLSMVTGGRFPFLTVLSMRGDFGEGNPWQMAMGQAVRPLLTAMGFIVLEITKPEEVASTVEAAANMTWKSGQAVALLLTQKLIGAKSF